jgi:hypothetical protein
MLAAAERSVKVFRVTDHNGAQYTIRAGASWSYMYQLEQLGLKVSNVRRCVEI